MDLKV